MSLSLIVAMSLNRVIGDQGSLPWRMRADLQRFKRLTMGHSLIMGRKTLDSIARLLPGRTTVVMTRDPDYDFPGARVAHNWDEALRITSSDEEAFVCGGAQIYEAALPYVDRIYLTLVGAQVEGDVFFPQLDSTRWQTVENTYFPADAKNEYSHQFQILQRKGRESDE